MRTLLRGALIATGAVWLALGPGSHRADAAPSSRQALERCVNRVVTTMARSKAPEAQVGSAVARQCDPPLRATIAEAIRSGEAAFCTVEGCLGLARSRTSAEAVAMYRQITSR